jgi:hypothetical protein
MPISRTVSGLIFKDELDTETGWQIYEDPPYDSYPIGTHQIDTSDKHSGTGSSEIIDPGYPRAIHMWRTINVGSGTGKIITVWHKLEDNYSPALYCHALCVHTQVFVQPPPPGTQYPSWIGLWVPGPYGDYEEEHGWQRHIGVFDNEGLTTISVHGPSCMFCYSHIDRIVIKTSNTLTVGGLVEDQKIELYRSSDDQLLDTQTCVADETTVEFDLSAEDCPLQLYLKIYATNGTTLIERSPHYEMCGGDTWIWTADAGTLSLTADNLIIYRGAATATSKTTAITANLKTTGGANYPGALISFSANTNGSISPASDTTDANGNAHATLSSLTTTIGLAVVKAQWLGDANVPACSAYAVVHVFYEAEDPDSSAGFQLYIEGYPLEFVSGKYGINGQGKPETIDVEIPEWNNNIIPFGLISVYRKGVKEFAGIYLAPDRHLSDAPRVTLRGQDQTFLLADRVVDVKIYVDETPDYIIGDLLTSFNSGITAGRLQASPDMLTITISAETLLAAIQRVSDAICWDFRVNLDRTLDLAENFGGTSSGASFTEGANIFDLDASSDLAKIANWIRMVGDGLTSTKQDGTNIMDQGLHQLPSFQTSISSQGTLDTACQALLDLLKDCSEVEVLLAYDDQVPGTFNPEDTVTVTAPSVDMAGEYQIKRIERDMTDANFVLLELSNRLGEYWELDEAYRRMIKDLSV